VSAVHDFTASQSMNTCTTVGTLSGRSIVMSESGKNYLAGTMAPRVVPPSDRTLNVFPK